jgi:uncharacterized membrane protein
MTTDALHPLAEDYLRRLRRAGSQLPPDRLRELMAEIQGHLAESIPPGASDREALVVLDRLGAPSDIVEAERAPDQGRNGRRGWRERAAVILLPLGGFAFGVGWLVGLFWLWTSRLWTTREKLIGTLIVPGGIATTLLVIALTATKRRCRTLSKATPTTTLISVHCTPSTSAGVATSAWRIALVVLCVLGPILTAVYLARRARRRSSFVDPLPTS